MGFSKVGFILLCCQCVSVEDVGNLGFGTAVGEYKIPEGPKVGVGGWFCNCYL